MPLRHLRPGRLPTPGGGKHWDHSFFRLSGFDDLYRPHTFEEVEAVVSPEVAVRLDKSTHYGLWWFDRLKTKARQVSEVSENRRVYRRETRRSVKPKGRRWPFRQTVRAIRSSLGFNRGFGSLCGTPARSWRPPRPVLSSSLAG